MQTTKNTLRMTALAFALSAAAGTSQAATITGVTIEDVSSQLGGGFQRLAINTVNGSGFDEVLGTHVTSPGDAGLGQDPSMWLSNGTFGGGTDPLPVNPGDPTPFITFDLEGNFDLNSVTIWNYNGVNETARGSNEVEILIASSEGGAFTSLGNFFLTEAPGVDNVNFGQTIDLSIIAGTDNARLVRFNVLSNHNGDNNFVGLSEVRFDGVPEPGSLALLGLGGLMVLRRRRN